VELESAVGRDWVMEGRAAGFQVHNFLADLSSEYSTIK